MKKYLNRLKKPHPKVKEVFFVFICALRLPPPEGLVRLQYGTSFINPAYNTISDPAYLYVGFGWAGIIFAGLWGFLSGLFYGLAKKGFFLGWLLFPSWAIGVCNFWRTPYFFSQRYIIPFVILVLIYMQLRSNQLHEPLK